MIVFYYNKSIERCQFLTDTKFITIKNNKIEKLKEYNHHKSWVCEFYMDKKNNNNKIFIYSINDFEILGAIEDNKNVSNDLYII